MICLNPEILSKLSSKGILAYVAVSMAGDSELSTATLASLVRAQTSVMLEGLKELAAEAPEKVRQNKKERTWTCGIGGGGGGPVPILGIDASLRFRDLIEDIKKYWDFLNPEVPFQFSGPDGVAVRAFLNDHPQWTRPMWQMALQHRGRSVKLYGNASRTQSLVAWVRKLGDYAGGPLNEYGKPVEGSGNVGKAVAIEHANNQAVSAYLNAGGRA
jgi:hypothetical protein